MDEVRAESLKGNWPKSEAMTRSLGDNWLRAANALLLRVPSAIMPQTWNVLINPLHARCRIT